MYKKSCHDIHNTDNTLHDARDMTMSHVLFEGQIMRLKKLKEVVFQAGSISGRSQKQTTTHVRRQKKTVLPTKGKRLLISANDLPSPPSAKRKREKTFIAKKTTSSAIPYQNRTGDLPRAKSCTI